MNLDQIATKCFILALFIRDDGERLLLGDGYYDFNQKLQHFQANTIANDVVEIQGDNGQLLAGQVMRSGAQKFEGYIGDATTNRQTIEQKRSDFMAFFRIKHFYQVIYIPPDGTAIQRRRGYLTDAPAVPEIFQKFPEYHIALNFEDVNYYEYAEDEYGDEIYAHIIELALSGNATGGLVWDAIGAVSNGISWSGIQTAQGEYISITNALDIPAKLASVEMLGKAEQDGTPTPDSPQPISVVTGENVVKIEGKNLFNTNDIVNLAPTTTIAQNVNYRGFYIKATAGDTYTLSRASTSAPQRFRVVFTEIEPANGVDFYDVNGNRGNIPNTDSQTAITFAVPNGMNYIFLYLANDGSTISEADNIQLEAGSTRTTYEPYQGQEFEVNLGKNLLSLADGTTTTSGITATISNQMITLTGTTSESWGFNIKAGNNALPADIPAGSYTIVLNQTLTFPITLVLRSSDTTQYYSTRIEAGNRTLTFSTNFDAHYYTLWCPAPLGTTTNIQGLGVCLQKTGDSTTFAPYFTPIELAKIGNYQDRIYKDEGKWYIEKQVGKHIMTSSDGWGWVANDKRAWTGALSTLIEAPALNSAVDGLCDRFKASSFNQVNQQENVFAVYTTGTMSFRNSSWASLDDAQADIFGSTVYYALATPTTTEITNEALIAQLDALGASSLFVGVNNIGTETQNAVPTLKIEYYTEYTLDGAGYEWEPGGNTAKTIVTVAGVDSAWPIWTVQGGAQNPTLTNITTGQTISWQGFVPEGQTLTINMAEMTADLAGANVFEYVTGEWIRLAPGNNTLVYTAGNADKPSTLSWNGVLA